MGPSYVIVVVLKVGDPSVTCIAAGREDGHIRPHGSQRAILMRTAALTSEGEATLPSTCIVVIEGVMRRREKFVAVCR